MRNFRKTKQRPSRTKHHQHNVLGREVKNEVLVLHAVLRARKAEGAEVRMLAEEAVLVVRHLLVLIHHHEAVARNGRQQQHPHRDPAVLTADVGAGPAVEKGVRLEDRAVKILPP